MLDKEKIMDPSNEILWLKVILFFTIALLLIAVLYTNENFIDINRNLNEVNKATKTIREVKTLETGIYRTEALVRLYVITHDPLLIKGQYDNGEQLTRVESLMAAEASMAPAMDSIKLLATHQFVIWNKLVNMPPDSANGSSALVLESNAITQNILSLTSRLKDFESNILDSNSRDTRNGVRVMTLLVIVSILFSIALFLFAFFKLNAQIKREALVHEQLQRKNQELDRSNKELEQFAYVASHDLQEPLRKIHAYSGRLASHEKDNLSPEGKEIIDKLQGFAQRMQRLIDDLLTFSRILQHSMQKKSTDLNKILAETRQTMSSAIQASGADILSDTLPVVMGYESQLLQLFQNLISNSIKYNWIKYLVLFGI
jgi:signal transduction histidine kinase